MVDLFEEKMTLVDDGTKSMISGLLKSALSGKTDDDLREVLAEARLWIDCLDEER